MAHTSSFSALIGHDPPPPDGGGGGDTTGGVGQYGVQPCTRARAVERMVMARNREISCLDAIATDQIAIGIALQGIKCLLIELLLTT